jgi:RNA polymerase sigma factor (sigma-70 family)
MDQEEMKAQFLMAYDAHADALYRFTLFKVSDAARAEDMVQEVFTEYWQTLRKNTMVKNAKAFLFTIARNRIIDWYRRKKSISLDTITEQGIEFTDFTGETVTAKAEFAEALKAVHTLDDTSRDAVLLRYIEGWSPQEIADLTHESANAISVRLNRAIKKIQDTMRINPTA